MPDTMALKPDAASRLMIPNQLSALRRMSEWLEETIRELDAPEQMSFKFDLCANEAVANIISYAYRDSGTHEITLSLSRDDDLLCLEIEDDGIAFDPLARPEHEQPESLADASIGGLGVDLIRKFMDECRYVRRNGHNVLTLAARIGH